MGWEALVYSGQWQPLEKQTVKFGAAGGRMGGQKCKKLEVLIWSQDLAFSKGGTCREIEAGELQ